jgi:hypothetical protein
MLNYYRLIMRVTQVKYIFGKRVYPVIPYVKIGSAVFGMIPPISKH